MPSGKYYPKEFRHLIYQNHVEFGLEPQFIMDHCLDRTNPDNAISLRYLTEICVNLHDPAFAADYLNGAKTYNKTGRPEKLGFFHQELLMDQRKAHPKVKEARLRQLYYTDMYGTSNEADLDPMERISLKIVKKVEKSYGWSRKESEYINVNFDPAEAVDYLLSVAYVYPWYFVDIDETGTDLDDFGSTSGYAPVGEKFTRTQFVVRGKHYSVIAAACPAGFICWRIFDGPVDDAAFLEFLRSLRPYLDENSFCIIDNAAIHHTVPARTMLEEIFFGRFRFASAYSPFLKPIEKFFALVKNWISQVELNTPEDYADPIELIDAAFRQFAIGGPQAHACLGHWNDYFELHANFLNNQL